MKIKKLIFAVLAGLLLTACAVEAYPGRAEVRLPSVTIGDTHGGNFCPPGQAKKGRC